jgi:NADPH-dependent 2,4-dienoyl-CoA reductase/sulfur reductase-like enzyme
MVAGFAAREMAEAGLGRGELTLVSADEELPYHRPPLSKGFLAGEEEASEILINEPGFYDDRGVALRLETRVEAVDLAKRVLTLAGGAELGFERLLLATGSEPRRLAVPGGDLQRVHTLRSMSDSRRIREGAENASRAVVVGGGFIGTEVAAVLADQGLETTLLFRGDRLLQSLFTPEMSHYLASVYRENGVTLRPGAEVDRFRGEGALAGVELASGDVLEADLVVLGLGALPVTGLFRDTGLTLDDGVVVDEHLATGVRDVWAAGDIARYRDPVLGGRRRVEHWDNAVEQGRLAGRNLLGAGEAYDRTPYFFSDVFDLSWELWGDPRGADEVAIRGELESGSFSAWWLQGTRVAAAFVMARSEDERAAAEPLIRSRMPVEADRLADPDLPLPSPEEVPARSLRGADS